MKLAILCTMINGFGRRGFYNSQEIGLGRALEELGHDVTIIKGLNRNEADRVDTVKLGKMLKIRYIPIPGFGAHGYLSPEVLDKDLDGVLCFSDNQIFLPRIEAYCKKHGIVFVPYVGTAHSNREGLHAKIMDLIFSRGTLKMFKKHRVITKTPTARNELAALGITDTVMGPVGLDFSMLKAEYATVDRALLRRRYEYAPDDVVLLNIARLEPEKRPDVLVEMLAGMKANGSKKYKLLLVGEGSMKDEIEEKVRRLGLSDDVRMISRVPYEEIWKLYHISDYFVNLNKNEIFGMAVMEAVFYETPVAASMAPGPSQTLADMPGHRICLTDKEMVSWLEGPYPSAQELHQSSRLLQERFSWKRCAEAFTGIVSGENPAF